VKKKSKLGCLGCAGVIAVVAVIGIAAAAASHKTKTTTTASTPSMPAASHSPAQQSSQAPAAPATTPAPAAAPPSTASAPQTLLSLTGSGIKNTAQFTTGDSWTLSYTYDCSDFGGTGNFIVSDETGMPLVNELQDKGSGSSPQYSAGTHHLEINSECKWTVKVTNG
jgi:hypothetical protein